jgi:hypothetical protein
MKTIIFDTPCSTKHKPLAALAPAALVFGLVACSSSNSDFTPNPPPPSRLANWHPAGMQRDGALCTSCKLVFDQSEAITPRAPISVALQPKQQSGHGRQHWCPAGRERDHWVTMRVRENAHRAAVLDATWPLWRRVVTAPERSIGAPGSQSSPVTLLARAK